MFVVCGLYIGLEELPPVSGSCPDVPIVLIKIVLKYPVISHSWRGGSGGNDPKSSDRVK